MRCADGVYRAGRPPIVAGLLRERCVQNEIGLALSPVMQLSERRAGLVSSPHTGAIWQSTTQGAADLHGTLPGGRALELEIKHPRARVHYQPGQVDWLTRCARLGGVAITARHLRDVLEALELEGYTVETAPSAVLPSGIVVVGLHSPRPCQYLDQLRSGA